MVSDLGLEQSVVGSAGHLEYGPALVAHRVISLDIPVPLISGPEMVLALILQSKLRVLVTQVRFDHSPEQTTGDLRVDSRFRKADRECPQAQICLCWRVDRWSHQAECVEQMVPTAHARTTVDLLDQAPAGRAISVVRNGVFDEV